jgi:hypothetical protein
LTGCPVRPTSSTILPRSFRAATRLMLRAMCTVQVCCCVPHGQPGFWSQRQKVRIDRALASA